MSTSAVVPTTPNALTVPADLAAVKGYVNESLSPAPAGPQ